jgi:hypothetical protein
MKKISALFLILCLIVQFSLVAFAAQDQYVVIKDKNGVCKVLKTKGKTPKTIAGPFKTKKQAQAAKEEKCPEKKK